VDCVAPAHGPGNVSVSVTLNNGGDWLLLSTPLTYQLSPQNCSFSPSSGPTKGGTLVTVTGYNYEFNDVHDDIIPLCIFGKVEVVASFSDNKLTCNSPEMLTSSGVTVDAFVAFRYRAGQHQLFGSNTTSFYFYDDIAITDVSPKQGSALGGTILQITGSGFENSPNLVTRFTADNLAPVYIQSVYVSSSLINVIVPPSLRGPNVPGQAKLSVSNNNLDFSEDAPIFYWEKSLIVHTIYPQSVYESANQYLLIEGDGFMQSFPNNLVCRFDENTIVSAIIYHHCQ